MKKIKRLRTTLLVAMAILIALPCAAQSDGGGKKKKKPVKTEQTPSANAKRKQEEARRQQEAEAKRKREAEAKRQQEAEARRRQEEEARRQREIAASRQQKTGSINGHEWVDLGLPSGLKWATCNVGATSPGDYGNYYSWGEIKPKNSYEWSNCYDCLDNIGNSWEVYKVGGKTQILPTSGHDTARENWGGTWRMPTESELKELSTECRWEWTTVGGHNGNTVTGPNGKSIFLPAAGYWIGTYSYNVGVLGYYWSSSLSMSYTNNALSMSFIDVGHYMCNDRRSGGQSVRPVTE